MAKFSVTGLEPLMLSMQQVAEIPEDVANGMLQAGGAVAAEAQKQKYRTVLKQHTGNLADSIQVTPKMRYRNGKERYVEVYPYGPHHTYNRRSKTTAYKRSKHGRTRTTGGGTATASNSSVAFVHEFGAPGRNIEAKGIMRAANEESSDAAVEAEYRVYDNWLKSKGL